MFSRIADKVHYHIGGQVPAEEQILIKTFLLPCRPCRCLFLFHVDHFWLSCRFLVMLPEHDAFPELRLFNLENFILRQDRFLRGTS